MIAAVDLSISEYNMSGYHQGKDVLLMKLNNLNGFCDSFKNESSAFILSLLSYKVSAEAQDNLLVHLCAALKVRIGEEHVIHDPDLLAYNQRVNALIENMGH